MICKHMDVELCKFILSYIANFLSTYVNTESLNIYYTVVQFLLSTDTFP